MTLLASVPWQIACAEKYPVRPVRVLLPFAPGGSSDLIARPMAQKLAEALGQTFVVDNRGGAGGAARVP